MNAYLNIPGENRRIAVEVPSMTADIFAMLKADDPNTVLAIVKINDCRAGICWYEKDGVERSQVLITDLSIHADGTDYKEA